MYLPFIMLRLWGWPGFLAFMVPNVLGCAAFGFVLDRDRSRALVERLGWTCALFSAITVAYQAWFAGWAAQAFVVADPAMRTVVATGVPIALLVAGLALAARGDAFWRTAGTVATIASPLVLLLPGGLAAGGFTAGGEALAATGDAAVAHLGADAPAAPFTPLLGRMPLAFALPTIVAGFLASPFFDLTFHRAVQQAPQPRVAFATFGLTFAAMLMMIATFFDAATGAPRIGPAIVALWALQLLFTVAVHLRELLAAAPSIRIAGRPVAALVAAAVLLATPAFTFTLGPSLPEGHAPLAGGATTALLPGEPLYMTFLGAYGLLFPILLMLDARGASRPVTLGVLALGLPCYLLGAVDFLTILMPVPIVAALLMARAARARNGGTTSRVHPA
jgi:hypothetical protein